MGTRQDDELELKIERALASAPRVGVPEDFAMRVAAQAGGNARRMPSEAAMRTSGVGERVTWVVAALLLLAVVLLAPGRIEGMRFWLAFALALEFAVLASALSLRRLGA